MGQQPPYTDCQRIDTGNYFSTLFIMYICWSADHCTRSVFAFSNCVFQPKYPKVSELLTFLCCFSKKDYIRFGIISAVGKIAECCIIKTAKANIAKESMRWEWMKVVVPLSFETVQGTMPNQEHCTLFLKMLFVDNYLCVNILNFLLFKVDLHFFYICIFF